MVAAEQKAIVIGAGIAGIAAAIRLRVQGFDVQVFEQNSYPGGKLSAFSLGSYQFDAGPSLFTQPGFIRELFELAGEKMAGNFSYNRMPVSCNYFYEDGTFVQAYADTTALAQELQDKLGEPIENTIGFLQQSADIYNHIGTLFLQNSLHKTSTLLHAGIKKALKYTRLSYLFKSMNELHEQQFRSPKTIQLFNRYATYNGSNPYKAPAMLTMIPHLEHNLGSYYPKGGMISITNALYELALRKGVRFHFNARAERIIRANNKVQGIVAGGENIPADVVVSNMDIYFTYRNLLGDEWKATEVLKQERSSSACIFYWGIGKSFDQLILHNIFFTKDYQAEFNHLFNTGKVFSDPTVYINITSKCEPGLQAPEGKENWFVMVNAPANSGQDWQAYSAACKKAVIEKLSRILGENIETLIEEEEVLTPETIEAKTASYMGSLYGTSSNSRLAAFMRHPNFSKQTRGLYFVGGSVHPGGGIPLCLSSAKIMAELVAKDYKTQQH
ncbi:MAG: phytoene desaturase [Sphingobacteriia bacterium]|nr:phytoene desaturase [Sphingobacteriia bacterium]